MNLLTDKTGTLFKQFLIPSLLSAAAISVFQLVDTIAIGQGVGADGVAAISVVTPLFGITSFLGVFVGIGASVPMGIALGEGNTEKYRACYTASLILLLLIALILWSTFGLFAEPIYTFFGANERLMPLVKEYGNLIIGFFPVFFLAIYLACVVRVDGAPNVAMWAVAASGIFNAVGDYLLVFPFKVGTGMAGAAIATVMGNAIQVLIFAGYLLSKKCRLRLIRPRSFRRGFRQIASSGFSTGFMDIAYIALTILLNNQVIRYGNETALAIFGTAFTCSSTAQRVFNGVGQSVQPIISANFGAGKPRRILDILRLSIITELILSAAISLAGILFPTQLTAIFMETTPELLAAAPSIIVPIFVSVFFIGIGTFSTYYFQSIMRSGCAFAAAMLRGILLSGLFALILPRFLGLFGIWLGLILAEVITFAFSILFFFITGRQLLGKGKS